MVHYKYGYVLYMYVMLAAIDLYNRTVLLLQISSKLTSPLESWTNTVCCWIQ